MKEDPVDQALDLTKDSSCSLVLTSAVKRKGVAGAQMALVCKLERHYIAIV